VHARVYHVQPRLVVDPRARAVNLATIHGSPHGTTAAPRTLEPFNQEMDMKKIDTKELAKVIGGCANCGCPGGDCGTGGGGPQRGATKGLAGGGMGTRPGGQQTGGQMA
jgi:bacteriocin-like protein